MKIYYYFILVAEMFRNPNQENPQYDPIENPHISSESSDTINENPHLSPEGSNTNIENSNLSPEGSYTNVEKTHLCSGGSSTNLKVLHVNQTLVESTDLTAFELYKSLELNYFKQLFFVPQTSQNTHGHRYSSARMRRRKQPHFKKPLPSKSESDDSIDIKDKLNEHEVNFVPPKYTDSDQEMILKMEPIEEEPQEGVCPQRPMSRRNKRHYSEDCFKKAKRRCSPTDIFKESRSYFKRKSAKVVPEDSSSSSGEKSYVLKRASDPLFGSDDVKVVFNIFQNAPQMGDSGDLKHVTTSTTKIPDKIANTTQTEVPYSELPKCRKRKFQDTEESDFLKVFIQKKVTNNVVNIDVPEENPIQRTDDWVSQTVLKSPSISASEITSGLKCSLTTPKINPQFKADIPDIETFIQSLPRTPTQLSELRFRRSKTRMEPMDEDVSRISSYSTIPFSPQNDGPEWSKYKGLGSPTCTSHSGSSANRPRTPVRKKRSLSDCFCLVNVKRTFSNLFHERRNFIV